ncbi:metallophosphoesterase [Haematomicrobium sanguinis]|uniref:metallophosphoesterase n=1 Tax=Haematomicrobium sanguinis TaxID=479106 RepID=UPI00068C1FFE|nr:metallophosphoesterase [Haematomicrobium sanguinis]
MEFDRALAVINVLSDVQGDHADFQAALAQLPHMHELDDGVVVVGDVTPRGFDSEYAAVREALAESGYAGRIEWAIGNHEFYRTHWADEGTPAQESWPNGVREEELFQSFYRFAGRDRVYTEVSFGAAPDADVPGAGVPGLILGSERYSRFHDANLRDEVWFSEEQFAWLEARLDALAAGGGPVLVFSHHPLPDTVSGTRNRIFERDYLEAERLLAVLGQYPNVFFFSGHTHWSLHLADWAVRRVVPGTGNPYGFVAVNTGVIETEYEDDGAGGERPKPGRAATGVQVRIYADRVELWARDFVREEWIAAYPVPLVGSD